MHDVIWVVAVIAALAVLGGLAMLLAGRADVDPLSSPARSTDRDLLPDVPTARDIQQLNLDTALRGYDMRQVDDVLDALQARVEEQDRELARLRGGSDGPQ